MDTSRKSDRINRFCASPAITVVIIFYRNIWVQFWSGEKSNEIGKLKTGVSEIIHATQYTSIFQGICARQSSLIVRV